MTATSPINNHKRYSRLLRIDYKQPNLNYIDSFYVGHLDDTFETPTVEDFVYRYKNERLIFLPIEKVIEIPGLTSIVERYQAGEEQTMALNTNNIYLVSEEKLPINLISTNTYEKLVNIGSEFTESELHKKLNLQGFKIYPDSIKHGLCYDFIIDYLKDFKLKVSYANGIEVESKTFNKLNQKYKRFFVKNDGGVITPRLKFFEDKKAWS